MKPARSCLLLFASLAFAGCYKPVFGSPGFYCHPSDDPACPDGQVCSPATSRCVDASLGVSGDGGHMVSGDGMGPVDLAGAKGGDQGASGACSLRINEVQTGGSSGAQDEFIELFNSCTTATDLSGDTLVYRSATGTTDINFVSFSGVSLPAAGYLVIGQTNFSGSAAVHYTASGMAATGGGLALLDSGGAVIDSLGYGNASNAYIKSAAASAPASAQSIGRKPDGQDTGDNALDFVILSSPTPGASNG